MEQIQEQILSEANVRRYIDLVLQQAHESQPGPESEQRALGLSIDDVDTKIRRWEDTLERGLLSLDDAAHRIKELRTEREALLKKKIAVDKNGKRASTCGRFRRL